MVLGAAFLLTAGAQAQTKEQKAEEKAKAEVAKEKALKEAENALKLAEAELKKVASGLPASTTEIIIKGGQFKKSIPLRENDIVFIKLIKQ